MVEFRRPRRDSPSSRKLLGINFFDISGLVLIILSITIPEVTSRGHMVTPAQRSSLWSIGFDSPRNDDDSGLNCGGPWVQHGINNGKCGVCGDRYDVIPRDNEPGGKYANGIIANVYSTNDSSIPVRVDIQTFQGGYFEFRICPNNNVHMSVTEECLNRHQLRVWDLVSKEPKYRYYPKGDGPQNLRVELPRGMTCTQCVLQWKWHTAKDWGRCVDGTSKLGCGPQEEFYNCADIAIEPSADYNVHLNRADAPLPSEGPRPAIDINAPTLGFEVGFKPYGQNLRQNLNAAPISFLPTDILRAGNIGPVLPKFEFYDSAAALPSPTPSVAPVEIVNNLVDAAPTEVTKPVDAPKQGSVVLEFNGNSVPAASVQTTNIDQTPVADTVPSVDPPLVMNQPGYVDHQTAVDIQAFVDQLKPTGIPSMIDQPLSANQPMIGDVPSPVDQAPILPVGTPMLVGPPVSVDQILAVAESVLGRKTAPVDQQATVDQLGLVDQSPVVDSATPVKAEVPMEQQVSADTSMTAGDLFTMLNNNQPPMVDPSALNSPDVPTTVPAKQEIAAPTKATVQADTAAKQTEPQKIANVQAQDAGGIAIHSLGLGDLNVKIGMGAIPSHANQATPTQEPMAPPPETGIVNLDSIPSSALPVTVDHMNAVPSSAPMTDFQSASMNAMPTNAPMADFQAANMNIVPSGAPMVDFQAANMNIAPSDAPMADLQAANMNIVPSGAPMVDFQAANMNAMPSNAPIADLQAAAMDILKSLSKPTPHIRRRRQAPRIPPPPGSSAPASAPPAPPMSQTHSADPGPSGQINFGRLIGDSFNQGASRTQTSFISPADFGSGRATAIDMTGEALIEPGTVNAPSAIGMGATRDTPRFDPATAPQSTVFEPMFMDPQLPGPASMHTMAEKAMQTPVDTGVPYENPLIPRPPKQSAAELEAAIAQAPIISSAISDTGKALNPSDLIGASYIAELNEGRSNQAETSTAARHSSMVIKAEMSTQRRSGSRQEYFPQTSGTSLMDSGQNTRAEIRSAKKQFGYTPTAEEILSGQASMFHPTQAIDTTNQEAIGNAPSDASSVVPSILNSIIGGGAGKPSDSSLDPAEQKTRMELIRKLGVAMGVIEGPNSGVSKVKSMPAKPLNAQAMSDPTLSSLMAITGGDRGVNLFNSPVQSEPQPQTQPKPTKTAASVATLPTKAGNTASSKVKSGVAIDFTKGLGLDMNLLGPSPATPSKKSPKLPKTQPKALPSKPISKPSVEPQIVNPTPSVAKTPVSATKMTAKDLLGAMGSSGNDLFGIPGMTVDEVMAILNVGQPNQKVAAPITGLEKPKSEKPSPIPSTSVPQTPAIDITKTKLNTNSKSSNGMSTTSFDMESAMFGEVPSRSAQQVVDMSNLGPDMNQVKASGMLNEMSSRSSGKTTLHNNLSSLKNTAAIKQLKMGSNDVGPAKRMIQGLGRSAFTKETSRKYRTANMEPPMTTVLAEMATTGTVAERIDKSKQSKKATKTATSKSTTAVDPNAPAQNMGATLTVQDMEALLKAQNLGIGGQPGTTDPTTGTLDMGNQMMFGLLGMGPGVFDPNVIDAMFGPTNQLDQASTNTGGLAQVDQQAEAKLNAISKQISATDAAGKQSAVDQKVAKKSTAADSTAITSKNSAIDKIGQTLQGGDMIVLLEPPNQSSAQSSTVQVVDTSLDQVLGNANQASQSGAGQEGTISLADLLSGTFGFTDPSAASVTTETGQASAYETKPKSTSSGISEIAINSASQGSAKTTKTKTDFTPLGEIGTGSQFEAMMTKGVGQEELIWDSVKQTWVTASSNAQTVVSAGAKQAVVNQADITVDVTKGTTMPSSAVGGFDSTASPFDLYGLPSTPLIGLIPSDQQKQQRLQKLPDPFTEKSAVKIQTVDPKPTQPTAAVETATPSPAAPIITTVPTVPTTTTVYASTLDPIVAEERRRLQEILDRQKLELQRLQQQKREQQRQLMLEKQRIEYEQRQLLLKQQQLEIERQKKAQLQEQMLLEKKKRQLAEQKEALRLQKLREEELTRKRQAELEKKRQAELKKAREAELAKQRQAEKAQLERQRQLEIRKQQEAASAALAKKKEAEARAAAEAAAKLEAETFAQAEALALAEAKAAAAAAAANIPTTTKPVEQTTTSPMVNTPPVVPGDAQASVDASQSFTPLGSVGGADANISPDAATIAAWKAYLQAQQGGMEGVAAAADTMQPQPPSESQVNPVTQPVSQPKIQNAMFTVPNKQVQTQPQAQAINPQTAQAWQFMDPNVLQQMQAAKMIPAVQPVVPGQLPTFMQTVPVVPNMVPIPGMQVLPGTLTMGRGVPAGGGIMGAWSGVLKQQKPQITPAPTTTTTTTTTPAPPTTTTPAIPIRPDPETRNFVRKMFLENMKPGTDPMSILVGLPPELIMKSGVNPRIVKSGDLSLIVPAVERTLGISLKPVEVSPSGRVAQRPGPRAPLPKKTPIEIARERREMMLQQRMMNEMLQMMGLAPEAPEPGDPGYRGPGATGRRAGGMGGMGGMGGRRTGGAAAPFEMTDAQQIAIEQRINRQRGLGGGAGGAAGGAGFGMGGATAGMNGMAGLGGMPGGGAGMTGTGW